MVGEGLRPLEGAATPAPLQRLLDDCWRSDRAARPAAQQLVDALQQMLVRRCGSRVVVSFIQSVYAGVLCLMRALFKLCGRVRH